MSALAVLRLERFGENDPFFKKWRSCRHCLQSEWALESLPIREAEVYFEARMFFISIVNKMGIWQKDPTATCASVGRLTMSKWGRSGLRYLREKDRSAKGESVFVANSAIEFRVDGAHSWLREWSEMGAGVCIKRWTGTHGLTGTKVNHKWPFYNHLEIFFDMCSSFTKLRFSPLQDFDGRTLNPQRDHN